jgi:lipopolysaccharide export system protein LptA
MVMPDQFALSADNIKALVIKIAQVLGMAPADLDPTTVSDAQANDWKADIEDRDTKNVPDQLGAFRPIYDLVSGWTTDNSGVIFVPGPDGNPMPFPNPQPLAGVDRSGWTFIRAAANTNEGQTVEGFMAREYTRVQYKLRHGGQDPGNPLINKMSNGIGLSVMQEILRDGGQIPNIDVIGGRDAIVVVNGYFNNDSAAWAGNAFFHYFGTNTFFQNVDPSTSGHGTYDMLASMYSMQQGLKTATTSQLFNFWLSDSYLNPTSRAFVMNNNSVGLAQTVANLNTLSATLDGWMQSNYYENWKGLFTTYYNPSTFNNVFTSSVTFVMGNLDTDNSLTVNPTLSMSKVIIRGGDKDDTIRMLDLPIQGIADGGKGTDTLDLSAAAGGLTVASKPMKGANEAISIKQTVGLESIYAYNFEALTLGSGKLNIDLKGSDVPHLQTLTVGDGNDTIKSSVVNLVINLGNGTDTVGPVGPGTVVNAGQGKDTFTVSNDELIAGTRDSPNDVIVTQGGLVLHGFVGPINSDSPWITSIYNGISYGLNSEGQLAIKDTLGNITYIADYKGGPTVPLSQQTDGIFVGRGSLKSLRLVDLTRPAIEEDAQVFKFANEIAFIRLGHSVYPGNDDPLVLDLAGNGIKLTGETSVSPMFDMQGTGFAVHTGWTQPGTGLLVVDDGSGLVKNINQLVGGENNSGFAALAQFDSNHDGLVDTNDPIFAQLRVWQDANSNAVVDPGEVETLDQAGITSINVAATAQTGLSIAGNAVTATGTFTRSDGTTGAIDDVSFTIDPFHSRYLGDTSVSAEAAVMPNLKGYGTLTDLQVAMTIDPALADPAPDPDDPFDLPTLIDITNANLPNLAQLDLTALRTAAMPIFDAWARAVELPDANGNLHIVDPASGHQDVPVLLDTDSKGLTVVDDFAYRVTDTNGTYFKLASGHDVKDSQGNVIARPTFADVMAQTPTSGQWTDFTADQIGFMERYLGHPLPIDSTGGDSGALIDVMSSFISASYEAMNLEAVRLAMQGPLNQYFPTIAYDVASDHFHATTDAQLAPMYQAIFNAAPADAAGATAWLTAWKPIIDVVLGDFDRGEGKQVSYGYMFASMVPAYEATHLPLSIADAAVALGIPMGEVVAGGATLTGTDDAQIFYLSGGDQTVNDTHSSQNFVIGGSFGHVVINADQSSGAKEQDVLRFPTIKSTDVTASRNGIDLTITVNATGQSVFLPGEFIGVRPGFFGTGNLNDVRGATEITFKDGVVWNMTDLAWAVAEHTQATNDSLIGSPSVDVLDGSLAHYLTGGDGGDVYLFGRGDGHVTIEALRTDALALNPDYVKFGPGITMSDLTFSRQGNSDDLQISINGTNDTLTILGQFAADYSILGPLWLDRIESFAFADGSSESWEDVIQNFDAAAPTSGKAQIYGFDYHDTLDGGPGVRYISGGNEDKTYLFDFNHAYDIIENATSNILSSQNHTILFGDDVSPQDVTFSRVGNSNDLLVNLIDGSTIYIKGEYNHGFSGVGGLALDLIQNFQFADGTVRTFDQILASLTAQQQAAGNDLYATDYGGTITIGAQNQYLTSGAGDTTFVFGHSSGHATIEVPGGQGNKIVQFAADVSPSDVTWSHFGDDLIIKLKNSNASLNILGEFAFTNVGQFTFADGTALSRNDVYNIAQSGTAGGDFIDASSIADWQHLPNNPVSGGPGNDVLIGVGGHVFQFNLGDGHDVILDYAQGGTPEIDFGAAVTPAIAQLHQLGGSLVFTFAGSTDRLTVIDGAALGTVKFADGTTWAASDIAAHAIVGPTLPTLHNGQPATPTFDGGNYEVDYNFASGYAFTAPQNEGTPGVNITLRVSGIVPSDVDLQQVRLTLFGEYGSSILISAKNSTSSGLLVDGSGQSILPFDQIVFDDGTTWTRPQVQQMLLDQAATTTGNYRIYGFSGNDTITAGQGDDILSGGNGNDKYVYQRGDGFDRIVTNKQSGAGYVDTLSFPDIASTEVSLERAPGRDLQNLVIDIDGENGSPQGQVTIQDEFDYRGNRADAAIAQIRFSDGVVWSEQQIEAMLLGQEHAQGSGAVIYGFDGSDTLAARTATAVLAGGNGADTYVWSAGDGPTFIADNGDHFPYNSHVTDTLDIHGIDPSAVTVTRSPAPFSHDLILTMPGQNPIVLEDQTEGGSNNVIGKVVFDDGTTWNYSDLLIAADGGAATAPNGTTARAFDGTPATATLAGTSSDDVYFWGAGDGNDTIAEIGGDPWAKADLLRLVGLNPGDVHFQIVENGGPDLRITNKATGETLTVQAQFFGASHDGSDSSPSFGYGIEKVIFADGTAWNAEQILQNSSYVAAPGNNSVSNSNFGDGTLPVDASPGVTFLSGISGKPDTYVWHPGDGSDTITDFGGQGEINTLRLAGTDPSKINLLQSGGTLLVTHTDTGDVNSVLFQFPATTSVAGISRIAFDDGTVWNRAYINANVVPFINVMYVTAASATYDTSNFNGLVVYTLGTGTFPNNISAFHDQFVQLRWAAGDSPQAFTIEGNNFQNSGTLVLNNLAPSDLSFYRSGASLTDLTIKNKTTGAKLTLYNQLASSWEGVATATFTSGNGTVWQQSTIAANSYITADSSTSGSYDAANIFNYPVIYDLGTGTFGNVTAHRNGAVEVIWGAGDSSEAFTIDGDGNNDNVGTLLLNNLNPSDVSLYRSGSNFTDLTIANKATGKTLTFYGELANPWMGVASVTFGNGTVWQASTIAANSYITAASSTTGSYDTSFIFNYPIIYDLGTGTFGNVNASKIGTVEVIWEAGDSSQQFTINGNGNNQNSGSLLLANLNPSDVSFYRSGTNFTDLTIANKATGATLRLPLEFQDAWDGVASVTFANGTTWQQATIAANTYITAASSTSGSYDTSFIFNYPIIYDLGSGTFGNVNASKIGAVEVIWGAADSSQQFTITGNGNNQNSGSLLLANFNPSDVSFYRSGTNFQDLTIANKTTGATLRLSLEFQDAWDGVASVTFADGTMWQQAAIAANSYITAASSPTGSYDTFFIFNYPVIYDLGVGTFGNVNASKIGAVEVIWGAADSSQQFTLNGNGNNQNSGSLLLANLNPSDVSFYRSGTNFTDLTIVNNATNATLTFYGEFANSWNGVASITFANGTVWQAPTIASNSVVPPTLRNVAATASFSEQIGAATLAPALSISDGGITMLVGATVSITSGKFTGDGDVLAATTTGTSITASYNSTTETLILSGSDTLARYQQVLDSITFGSTSQNPNNYGSNPTRVVTWMADNGRASNNLSAPQTTTVSITAVNNQPTLSNVTASDQFTEAGSAVTLAASVAISDPDNLTLAKATVAIAGGTFAGDGDVLAATTTGTSITASYNAATESLTLSGNDTLAHYQQVLDSVTFSSESQNPTNYGSAPTRMVTWTLNDGNAASATATTTINITSTNNAPTLAGTAATVSYTETSSAVTLSPSAAASDPDNLTLASATVKIVGGTFAGDGDVLAATTTGTSITASYNAATETLTLSGNDTLAHYQQVLDSITFASASQNPTNYGSAPTRTVSWTLNDGNAASATATTAINIASINNAPTLAGTAATAPYTETGSAVTLSPSAAASDPDNLTLASATVKIVGGTFAGDGDVLAATTTGTSIIASYNAATESLTLSGNDTPAHYQQVLDTVTFAAGGTNPSNYGSNPTRTVTWTLNDGNAASAATTTINITSLNNAPTVSGVPASASFNQGAAVPTLGPTVTISDPDNLRLAGATVSITSGKFTGDGDVLAATTTGTTITASYNSTTETLTLSGSDTLANYQQVLDSVTFNSTSLDPTNSGSNPNRVVTWIVNDGNASNNLSTAQTETIGITLHNPTLSNVLASLQFTEGNAAVNLSGSVTVTDPKSATLTRATIAITGGTFAGDGDVLAATVTGTGITASYNSTTETLILSGSDTLARYQKVLRTITFNATGDNPDNYGSNPTRTITWVLNDGGASNNLSAPQTETVGITALNDPPTLTSVSATKAFTEAGAAATLSPTVTVSDLDNFRLAAATVSITAGKFTGDGDLLSANTAGTSITASYNTTSETLTLTGSDTLADYRQVLDSVTFASASQNPTNYGSNPTRTVTWVLNDGSASSNSSTPQTETVSVTAINNPPTLSNVAASAQFTAGQGAVSLSGAVTVADPDNLNLTKATVAITVGTFAGDGDVLAATTTGTSITASYNSTTETLTLTGNDTLAHYQTVLRSVTFNSTSANPTNSGAAPTRVVTWLLNDGSASNAQSTTAVTTIAIPPKLTIGSQSITVAAGSSIALPITVSPSGSAVTVNITGLASYETITDHSDSTVFSGNSITLTAAEVNSGLMLNSSYTGTGHPVNTLTVTANDTANGQTSSSAPQTITVTDPPLTTSSTDVSGAGLHISAPDAAANQFAVNDTGPALWRSHDPVSSSADDASVFATDIAWGGIDNSFDIGRIANGIAWPSGIMETARGLAGVAGLWVPDFSSARGILWTPMDSFTTGFGVAGGSGVGRLPIGSALLGNTAGFGVADNSLMLGVGSNPTQHLVFGVA